MEKEEVYLFFKFAESQLHVFAFIIVRRDLETQEVPPTPQTAWKCKTNVCRIRYNTLFIHQNTCSGTVLLYNTTLVPFSVILSTLKNNPQH